MIYNESLISFEGKGGHVGGTISSTPPLIRTLASWPTCLYALRRGTRSRDISISRVTSLTVGESCLDEMIRPGFQSGMSSAANVGRYHLSRPSYCQRSSAVSAEEAALDDD